MNSHLLVGTVLAATAMFPVVCVAQGTGSEAPDPLISATGAAQVLVPPVAADLIVLAGGDGPRGGTVVDSLLGRIQDTFRQVDTRISMFGFHGSERRRGRDETRAYFSRYGIRSGIVIASLPTDSVGSVIHRLREAGVHSAVAVSYTIDEADPAITDAIRQATETARQHAEAMASAANGTLGRVVRLTTHRINADDLRHYDANVTPDGYTAPQHIGVRVTVHGTWVLQLN